MEKEFTANNKRKSSGKRPVKDRYGEYMVETVAHHHQQKQQQGRISTLSLVHTKCIHFLFSTVI